MRDIVTLALDRAESVRSIDGDGHLRVAVATLSRAIVSQYAGREIPNAAALGLQPDTIYAVLRPADELAKGAPSFRGKPLLSAHAPQSSGNHDFDLVVGAVGNDVTFDGENLRGSLSVWDQTAIDDITSGAARDLSAGYRYVAVPETGVFQGVPYTLKMTCIQGNHVAIVPHGRTPGATVGDAAMPEQPKGKTMSETVVDPDAGTDLEPTDALGKVLHFLVGKLSADDLKQVRDMLTPDEAEDDEEVDPKKKKPPAMDSNQLMRHWQAIRTAEDEVRPYVGQLHAMASAAAVYKFALDAHGVDLRGIAPSSFKGMMRMLPSVVAAQRGAGRRVSTSDAASKSFNEMFPDVAKVRVI